MEQPRLSFVARIRSNWRRRAVMATGAILLAVGLVMVFLPSPDTRPPEARGRRRRLSRLRTQMHRSRRPT